MEKWQGKLPFILGLIGGVGAGKSTVLGCLEKEYGFYVIQTDLTARKFMEPGGKSYRAVVDYLGDDILAPDKTIDRAAMARLIFADAKKCAHINAITHPLVWNAVLKEAGEHKNQPVVIETALPSKEFDDNCQEMWYVYTSRENRAVRLMTDRGYSPEKVSQIMEKQPPEETFRSMADAVIDNNGTAEQTRARIRELLRNRF